MKKIFSLLFGLACVSFLNAQVSLTISSSTNVSCNGGNNGAANTTTSGGTGPFTYAWTPTGGTNANATGLSAGSYTCTVTDQFDMTTASASVTITEPPVLSATMSSVNASCYSACNGSASVIASGGTGVYTYSWAPSGGTGPTSAGLCQGAYTVTISSPAGCNITRSVLITSPPNIVLSITSTASACYSSCNGSATCTIVSGGNPPFNYSWAPSGGFTNTANNLCAGSYTCTVSDANGCANTQFTIITSPPLLTSTLSTTNGCTPCTGTATVTTTGGNGPYTYSWMPMGGPGANANSLCAGNYTVTTTDNIGCAISNTFSITNTPLSVSCYSTPVYCNANNGSAGTTVSGGSAPFTYYWSNGSTTAGINSLSSGAYSVTVTDACGATATASVTVTSLSTPTATITSVTNATCSSQCNGTITGNVTGGSGPYSFSWAPIMQWSATATGLCPGTYTFTVTDANGCTSTASSVVNSSSTFVANVTTNNSGCTACTGTAAVNASGGTLPYTYSWSNSATTSNISNLCPGNYTCTVTDSTGCYMNVVGNVGINTGFTAVATSTSPACQNGTGSGTVTITGGLPPYTYLWQPTNQTTSVANNLYPGVYHIIVGDQSGCYASIYDTIHGPGWINSYITTTQMNCTTVNGMAVVHVFGGTPPYTYLWSNGCTNDTAAGLSGGNYFVTITDAHGCTSYGYTTIFTACDNIVRGHIYRDPNMNCIYDGGDSHLYCNVYTIPGGYSTNTDYQGNYVLHIPVPGSYTVHCSPYAVAPNCPSTASWSVNFPNLGDTLLNKDFSFHNLPIQNIGTSLSTTQAVPGFPVTYHIYYYNNGNQTVNNVVLTLNHLSTLTYSFATLIPNSMTGTSKTWNIGTLSPGSSAAFDITFTVPANATLGNSLCANAAITPLAGENNTYDNYANTCTVISGSFDPNFKLAFANGLDPVTGHLSVSDTSIVYYVQFQNTGTDTAFNIIVADTLSNELDASTLEPGASSHPFVLEQSNGIMHFSFYNIMLPDSNVNESASHGWFTYRIKTRQGILPGAVINNTAAIYFDYNVPVMTNTISDTVWALVPASVLQYSSTEFHLYPNPVTSSVNIIIPGNIPGYDNSILISDALGREVMRTQMNERTIQLDLSELESGMYLCTLLSDGNVIGVKRIVKE